MSGPERLKGNECGIVLDSTSIHDHGEWMCKVFIIGNALVKSKNVIVTSKFFLQISSFRFLR